MQEVEDGITSLSALESADRQARTAVETARLVFELATARYEGGASGQRLLTSVFLIKALGGDWERPARLVGG